MTIISRTIAIWDIDSTIANNDHRAVLLTKICKGCDALMEDHSHRSKCQNCGGERYYTPQRCWDAFLNPELILKDTPIPEAQRLIAHMRQINMDLHFVTGRNESLRDCTQKWLEMHFDIQPREDLWMRDLVSDGKPASVMKEELLYQLMTVHRLDPKIDNFIFFEDDTHVFTMYQKYGLVIKCPEGLKYFCPEGEDRSQEPSWKR